MPVTAIRMPLSNPSLWQSEDKPMIGHWNYGTGRRKSSWPFGGKG
jgi:hypothetical protein